MASHGSSFQKAFLGAAGSAGGFEDPFWIYQYSNGNDEAGTAPSHSQPADQLGTGSTISALHIRANSGQQSADEFSLPIIDVNGSIVGSNMPYFYWGNQGSLYLGGIKVVSDPDEVWLTGFSQAPTNNGALFIARLDCSNEASISLDSVTHIYANYNSSNYTTWYGATTGQCNNFVHIGTDYYVSGRSLYNNSDIYYPAIAKFNSSDVKQWANEYRAGTLDGENNTKFNSITTDGSYIYQIFLGKNNERFTVQKVNTSGAVQWSKLYACPYGQPAIHGIAYNSTSDEIVVAITDRMDWHGGYGKALFVASLSKSNGNVSWSKVHGNSGGTYGWDVNTGENVFITSSGNIVVSFNGNAGIAANSKPSGAGGIGVTLTVVIDGSDGSWVRGVLFQSANTNRIAQLQLAGGRITQNDNMILTMPYDKATSSYGPRWIVVQFPLDGSISSGNYTMSAINNTVMYMYELVDADRDDDNWSLSGSSQTPTVTAKAVVVGTSSAYTLASFTNNEDAIVTIS